MPQDILNRDSGTEAAAVLPIDFLAGTKERWLVQGVSATLTTSAGVGARQMVVELLDGALAIVLAFPASATVTASLSRTFAFGPGLPDTTLDQVIRTAMPVIAVPPGFTLRLRDSADIDATLDAARSFASLIRTGS